MASISYKSNNIGNFEKTSVIYLLSLDPRVFVLGRLVPAKEVGNLSEICQASWEAKFWRVVMPMLSRTFGSGDIIIIGVWLSLNV